MPAVDCQFRFPDGNSTSGSFSGSPDAYYEDAMTHIQLVCEAAEVLPCEFDAAVFASADEEEWPENDMVF